MKRQFFLILLLSTLVLVIACTYTDTPAVPTPVNPPPTDVAPGIVVDEEGRCNLSAIMVNATWQVLPAYIRGEITVFNLADESCTIQGVPAVVLTGRDGMPLKIEQVTPPDANAGSLITLDPRSLTKARLTFRWENWCRERPATTETFLLLTIPGYAGRMKTIFQDPNGKPLDDTPPCEDFKQDSTLEVGAFSPVD